MNSLYGDTDQRPNTRRNTIPLCRCGCSGRMIEDDFGYTVVCTNKNCQGFAYADNEALDTREAAWGYWRYKNGESK